MDKHTASGRNRLCFLIQSHYSHTMGGIEYQAKLMLDALCRKNTFDIYYLCRNTASDFVPIGYKVQRIGNSLGKYGLYFDAFNLHKALTKIAPHIIYQNGGSSYIGIAALYAKQCGAKLIWHIASDNNVQPNREVRFRTRLKNFLGQFFLNYGIRNADVIVGQTKHQNDLLRNRYGRICDVIIPPGHPLPVNKIVKSENVVVLWIGNLRSLKQPELFVNLARQFHGNSSVSFVMIGGSVGPISQFANLMEQIRAVPNLCYLGQVSPDEVNRWLREGHVLVNTSRYEGFSNTFVQAWLREVPVVSLNVDPDDILVGQRIGFHSKTFERLVSDVATLVENKALREEMGKRARSFAEDKHTTNEMVERLLTLFEPVQ